MEYRYKILIVLLIILMLIYPVGALKIINSTDFRNPDINVTRGEDFISTDIIGGKIKVSSVFKKGDSIEVEYIIEPDNEEIAEELGGEQGRSLTVRTELNNPRIDHLLKFSSGGVTNKPYTIPGKNFKVIELPKYDPDAETSVSKITFNLQGTAPDPKSRAKEVYALRFELEEAQVDAIPPLVILVIDETKFETDQSKMDEQLENLNQILDYYTGKTDTSNLNSLIKSASDNLSLSKSLYNDELYKEANDKLNYASDWIEKSYKEAEKVKASYAFSQAEDKVKDIENTVSKIEFYIAEIEDRDLINATARLNYKLEFKDLQEETDKLKEDLSKAEAHMDNDKFTEAEVLSNQIINDSKSVKTSSDSLFGELSRIISPEETPTAIETSTTEPESSFEVPNIDFKLIGIVLLIIILIGVGGLGGKKFLKRKKWDELK